MARDDTGYNYFVSLWTNEENERPVKITRVTSTSIEADVTVTTIGSLEYGKYDTEIGLYAQRSRLNVWGPWNGGLGTSSAIYNDKTTHAMTEFPHDYSPNAMYTKKYKVVLSNETKQANCPVFRTNDEYWVYGYVLDGHTDFQDWKDKSIESISGIYDSWENLYHLWTTGNGSYFWPSGNEGIKVTIPPEGYITLDLNQDDVTAFNSLKYGQIGTIRYTHTETIYDAGNAGVFSEEKLKHYYRYKFDNQDEWSSWIEASKISNSNNYSLSVQKNSGNTLKIQFARGNTSEEFAQTYYDTGFYLSDITEKTINLISQDTSGKLKTLESPEYTIEIWKSRLSDEAKYQFIEYLDNSFAYATNKNVVNFDFDFNEMINMRFEAEISFSSDTHEQALFGSDYKTKFGYAVFVKRNSATSKSIGIYDSTCSTYSDIVYHSFNAKDDERIKIAVGTEGIFVNDEKISSQAPVITTAIPGSFDIGLSLFNMSEIHNFVGDWTWTSGKKLNTSGTLDNNSSYSTTDYLPLTVYDNYYISGSNVNNDIVCYYTENKTLDSYSNPTNGSISIYGWNSPIKYFRYSHVNSDLNSIKIINRQSSEYDRSPSFPAYPYVLGKAFTGKIYSFKVFDEEKGEYSFDFSPCYNKESSEQGFYDNLHKVFYRAYTGSQFKSGPNIAAKTYGMLVDISNICVSSLNLSKERNLPDTLSVDIEYIQFKKKLASENTSISDVIKPYLVDIVVKRNFETIFTGTLMYAKVTLQAVGKQTLTLQAMGYGEQFAKRYINCSYGDMNYPQMAKQIVYDAQHEMNWIDNYDFLSEQTDSGDENDTSYFNGWGALDTNYNSYIPVKAPNTNAYLAHWQNGSIPIDYGCMLQCFKMSCSPLRGGTRWGTTGNYNQYLIVEYYLCNPALIDTIKYDSYEIYLTFTFETDGDDNLTNTYSIRLKDDVKLSNSDQGVNWTKCSHLINLGKLQGSVKHIIISNDYEYSPNKTTVYINDLNIYRPSGNIEEYYNINTIGVESNVAATVAYNLGMSVGYFDDNFNNEEYYPTNRVRHYHRVNAKDAMYNLAKLEDQNFEYIVDNDGKFKFKVAQGDLVVRNVATYPGQISEVSIERDASILYNVGYAINTHLYDNSELQTTGGQSFEWTDMTNGCAIDEDSCATYKARVQMVEVDTTTRREIDSEAVGAIYASDEVQNIPTLKFDSNIYNPGNVHLGDAFGVNVNIDSLFDFINGEYRVYGYSLSVSKDHVENMDITLMIPNALQLQLMTFPTTMKNMMNNIKRLQIKSNK